MVNEDKLFQDRKSLEKEEEKEKEKEAEPLAGSQDAKQKKAETPVEKKAAKEEKIEVKKESRKDVKKEVKKAEKDEKEVKKREIVLSRAYNVPLVKAYKKPQYFRANAATKILRSFVERHMKSDLVKISPDVNNALRVRGSGHPLKKVSIVASKDKDGLVTVDLKK